MVKEYFPYFEREEESKVIVDLMIKRQKDRQCPLKQDKMNNPLIAMPGSPGSGKSTFLIHFPQSAYYRKYAGNNAIVCPLTFNGAMSSSPILAFGVRILYGACMTIGVEYVKNRSFEDFVKDFQSMSALDISALDAVCVLRQVFGGTEDRKILILVDEISKANGFEGDKDVMKQIEVLLDNEDHCDVIFSALSPKYVKDLASDSNRIIKYIVPTPMLDSQLGRKECESWANILISKAELIGHVNDFKKNLLRNSYLLLSGHPRSLEFMSISFNNHQEDWEWIVAALTDRRVSMAALAFKLSFNFSSFYVKTEISEFSESVLSKFVFGSTSIFVGDEIRLKLESGAIHICKKFDGDRFLVAIQANQLLQLATDLVFEMVFTIPLLKQVQKIFRLLLESKVVSYWWELFVLLTAVCRSYKTLNITSVFGVDFITDDLKQLELSVVTADASRDPNSSYVIIPPMNHSGYDAIVSIADPISIQLYLQMKIKKPQNQTLSNIVAKLVANGLQHHLSRPPSSINLSNIFCIVYIWDKLNTTTVTKEAIQAELVNVTSSMDNCHSQLNKTIDSYLNNNFNNIKFVDRDQLEAWLLPSLIPFPRLLTNIGID